MYCLYSPPISTAFAINPSVDPIFDVPLLPHPVEAVPVLVVHFSMHCASVASISHLFCEPHLQQPVNLYVHVAEVDNWQVVMEEGQVVVEQSK
jgi:hypothetical protein